MKDKLTPEELIAIIENEKRKKQENQLPLQEQIHIPEEDPGYQKRKDHKETERGVHEYRF